jgi:hypothetical protein
MSHFLTRLRKRLTAAPSRAPRPRSARPAVEALDSRITPAVVYHGGALIAHANVSSVFYGQNWNTDDPTGNIRNTMIDFMKAVVKSPYMAQLGEYGVGRGTIGSAYVPVYSGPTRGGTVTEAQIQGLLTQEILNGKVPWAGSSQLYFVYLSPGVTSAFDQANGFAGHHSSFTLLPGIFNQPVYYAVIPDTGFSSIASLTAVTSHELGEAVTDPDLHGGWYSSTGAEIGDGLEGQNGTLVANGYGWTVQKLWSNYFGKGIVANGSQAGLLDVPPTTPYAYQFGGWNTYSNGGRTTTYSWSVGWDGRYYLDFVTAAGDFAGTFTINA